MVGSRENEAAASGALFGCSPGCSCPVSPLQHDPLQHDMLSALSPVDGPEMSSFIHDIVALAASEQRPLHVLGGGSGGEVFGNISFWCLFDTQLREFRQTQVLGSGACKYAAVRGIQTMAVGHKVGSMEVMRV